MLCQSCWYDANTHTHNNSNKSDTERKQSDAYGDKKKKPLVCARLSLCVAHVQTINLRHCREPDELELAHVTGKWNDTQRARAAAVVTTAAARPEMMDQTKTSTYDTSTISRCFWWYVLVVVDVRIFLNGNAPNTSASITFGRDCFDENRVRDGFCPPCTDDCKDINKSFRGVKLMVFSTYYYSPCSVLMNARRKKVLNWTNARFFLRVSLKSDGRDNNEKAIPDLNQCFNPMKWWSLRATNFLHSKIFFIVC